MAKILACPDNVIAQQVPLGGPVTDASTSIVYPAGTVTFFLRCAGAVPIIVDTNSIEQIAHPVMDAEDYSILSSAVVLGLVTAFGIKTVRKMLEKYT